MERLSQAPPRPQPARRCRSRRPFVLELDGLPSFSTEALARAHAQVIADREGRHVNLRDRDRGAWLPRIDPRQFRCPNGNCRRPVAAADWSEVYRTYRCAQCAPPLPPMAQRRKAHAIPEAGFHKCLASYAGSQCRCGSVYHALEIDPAGAPPCGHLVQEHGAEAVAPAVLGYVARVSDLQRCRALLQAWVLRLPSEQLTHPRFEPGRLLTTCPEPDNPTRAAWALLWWANNAEAAAWLRREIDERLAAEGHGVAA